MEDKIQTLHPQAGKQGVHISRAKYDAVRDAILAVLKEHHELTHTQLDREVAERIPTFDGSISWYTVSVKLDLEARDILERIQTKPPKIRIK